MPGFEVFGESERKEVGDVLETGVLMRYGFDGMRGGHWKARALERAIADKLGVRHAQMVSSGTAALSMTLASCGIGAGDEVIVPTFTFVATFEAVLSVGAIPVLADIDDTLCLSPEAIEQAITPNTKAVVPVHMCGGMAQLDRIKAICEERGVLLIEDACQAIGASFQGKALGTFGSAGCFSFDYVKTITCGEGGAMVTDDDDLATKADGFQDHGHDHVGNDRGAESHPFMGLNFRISELNAAVGLAQFRRLDEIIATQRKNKKVLKEALGVVPEVSFRRLPDPEGDNASFLSFFLPSEESTRAAIGALAERGVDACFYWYDNNWHYIRQWDHLTGLRSLHPLSDQVKAGLERQAQGDYSASDAIMSRTISCLIKLSWSESEVAGRAKKMVEAVRSVV